MISTPTVISNLIPRFRLVAGQAIYVIEIVIGNSINGTAMYKKTRLLKICFRYCKVLITIATRIVNINTVNTINSCTINTFFGYWISRLRHNAIRRDKTPHQRIIKSNTIDIQIEAALEVIAGHICSRVGEVEGGGVGDDVVVGMVGDVSLQYPAEGDENGGAVQAS